jgi:hypothetical protein
MEKLSRRKLLQMSGVPVGMIALGLAPLAVKAQQVDEDGKELKIVVVGAHPDDPETGCGGTMCLFSSKGHKVVSAYLTRGEAGIRGNRMKKQPS